MDIIEINLCLHNRIENGYDSIGESCHSVEGRNTYI